MIPHGDLPLTEPRLCPDCGAELPAKTPEGLCPKCLLKAGLESLGGSGPEQGSTAKTPRASGFVPPTPEDLARHFPQMTGGEHFNHDRKGAAALARARRD